MFVLVQPINLLMSHFNVEHSAQMSKSAIAAAQDTGQGQEVAREGIRRAQVVQAGDASAEMQKVHRRTEDEEREGRQRDARDSFQRSKSDEEQGSEAEDGAAPAAKPLKVNDDGGEKGFEFYA